MKTHRVHIADVCEFKDAPYGAHIATLSDAETQDSPVLWAKLQSTGYDCIAVTNSRRTRRFSATELVVVRHREGIAE